MNPSIIGIAVNTPIWKRNCVLSAAVRAVLSKMLALVMMVSPTPDNACKDQPIVLIYSELKNRNIYQSQVQDINLSICTIYRLSSNIHVNVSHVILNRPIKHAEGKNFLYCLGMFEEDSRCNEEQI